MKKSIPLILLLCVLAFSFQSAAQTVQYVTLYAFPGSTNLAVQANQLISVAGYDWQENPQINATMANGSFITLNPIGNTFNVSFDQNVLTSSSIPEMATGLTNIEVVAGWATFKITTPVTASVITNYVPADAIVIPASATGNVQIILESSPDLVNWTAAQPGTYGPSAATNRFFRVRAVAN